MPYARKEDKAAQMREYRKRIKNDPEYIRRQIAVLQDRLKQLGK